MRLSLIATTIAALAVNIQAQESNSTTQNATEFALIYGHPLLAYEKIRLLSLAVGINTWYHYRGLQGAGSTAVVKPNVDTIYSAMVYDISHNDLVVSIPEGIPDDQFALISFFDPYGTNWMNLGSGNVNNPGNYRITYNNQVGDDKGNGTSLPINNYYLQPSLYGFVLIRWLLNNTNLDAIHEWQDKTVNASIPVPVAGGPNLTSLPMFNKTLSPAGNTLNLLTAFAPYTLPAVSDYAANINTSLAAAGISNGTYTPPSGLDLEAANKSATASIAASVDMATVTVKLNNGWFMPNTSLIGTYGNNYAYRAAVSDGGYLAIKSPNAIYPSWVNSSDVSALGGNFVLGSNDAYIFTFSSIPPLMKSGFWSLTAYQNNYLINNTQNVYAITSERSNITYPNGDMVPRMYDGMNRTYQVLIQPADKAPPSNWTGNWLPGPAGGGVMQVTLRLYAAEESLIEGNWQYPVVTKQSAITNSSATSPSNAASSSMSSSTPTSSSTTYTGGAADLKSWTMVMFLITVASILFQLC